VGEGGFMKRREFLEKAGCGMAGVAAVPLVGGQGETIRVGEGNR